MKKSDESEAANLRQKAEVVLKRKLSKTISFPSEAEALKLMHELEVYHIELEMQNAEIRSAKTKAAEVASEKFSRLYDNAPSGYFTLSKEGKIIELNTCGAHILGKVRKTLVNSRFDAHLAKDTKPFFNLFLSRVFAGKPGEKCEVTITTRDKGQKHFYLSGLISKNGEQCVVTMVDIPDHFQASEELKKKISDLIMLNSELEQYAYANQELSQFAYTASHQLQEPIRTISNYLEIIIEDYSDSLDYKVFKYFQIINDATQRMTALINSLLEFSRLGRNKKLVFADSKQLIDSVIADLHTMINTSNATIEVTEMPKLFIYEIEFRQLFQNLIANAIKFRRKDISPEIQIHSERINGTWKFSVTDNGIGIAPVHFDRIFDIFQRLHASEDEFEGKGIGLAYCKKIVQLHLGEIWVEPAAEAGTTFHFTIPNLRP